MILEVDDMSMPKGKHIFGTVKVCERGQMVIPKEAREITGILSMMLPSVLELFGCRMMATKVPRFAEERKAAVEQLGFAASEERGIPAYVPEDGRGRFRLCITQIKFFPRESPVVLFVIIN